MRDLICGGDLFALNTILYLSQILSNFLIAEGLSAYICVYPHSTMKYQHQSWCGRMVHTYSIPGLSMYCQGQRSKVTGLSGMLPACVCRSI